MNILKNLVMLVRGAQIQKPAPVIKKLGRPLGSKNKPKTN